MTVRFSQFVSLLLASLLLAAPTWAYDRDEAAEFARMFAPVQGAKAGKHLHLMSPEQFVKTVRGGKSVVMLDIRTPNETMFVTGNLPGHMAIPLNELFQEEQLARLPTDKPIVVFCASGTRATAAATALRDIGFGNTYVLKGGFKGLMGYLGPKQAYQPLGPSTAAR